MTGGVASVAAVSALALASWTLGRAASTRLPWPELAVYERIALRLTAGLGLLALLLSTVALAGALSHARMMVGVLAVAGAALAIRDIRHGRRVSLARPTSRLRPAAWAVVAVTVLASAGAIAPVTDDDALAYVIPIARHIADSGAARVWTDQARSMWPESQQVLLAVVLQSGGDRLGMLTAFQWMLTVGVVCALARRACETHEHVWVAAAIALGSPVVAFQVSSAKEDLFLVAAGTAAAFCLLGARRMPELAAAGMFAGMAAGAKYPGALVAAGVIAWVAISAREHRVRNTIVVVLCSAMTGVLWYGVNLWRYRNPVAPLALGASGTLWDAATIGRVLDGYRPSHGVPGFLLAPIEIFLSPDRYSGRANLFNPLAYAGVAALFTGSGRRRHGPLLFIAAACYAGWFMTLQNARLLLPAAVLLAPAAADRIVPWFARRRWAGPAVAVFVVLSTGIVAAVGAVRFARWVQDPATFLERETQHYADIAWMNAHLDRTRDRVGSIYKVLGYLEVPSLVLSSSQQIEIADDELRDLDRLLTACRRQGITHLFGPAGAFTGPAGQLRLVYTNPTSRLGGVRFFREPPTEATEVFEITTPSSTRARETPESQRPPRPVFRTSAQGQSGRRLP